MDILLVSWRRGVCIYTFLFRRPLVLKTIFVLEALIHESHFSSHTDCRNLILIERLESETALHTAPEQAETRD